MRKDRTEDYLKATLTDEEIWAVTTPLGQLNPEGKQLAIAALDKYWVWIREENAAWDETEDGKKWAQRNNLISEK